MKTILPAEITNVEEAKQLLKALYNNGETFHQEDDCHTIVWTTTNPTPAECDLLNKLMNDIYNLPGNDGECIPKLFDLCRYLLELDLDMYTMNENPATCPKCGSRTDGREVTEGGKFAYSVETCLNMDCQYTFKMVEN